MDKNQIQSIIRKILLLYGKSLWENVFIFFLLDVFFGLIVVVIVCALGLLVQYFLYPSVPVTVQHIRKATVWIAIIYIVSIFVVSFWRHLSLIKGRNVLQAQDDANSSHGNETPIKTNESNA